MCFFNPPYDSAEGEGRAPAEGKRAAFIADRPIDDWIKVWSNRMGADANMTLIHRAHKLGEILAALEGRLGGVDSISRSVRCEREGTARDRARMEGIARAAEITSQVSICIRMHVSTHKYTPEAEAILRGDAHISFG